MGRLLLGSLAGGRRLKRPSYGPSCKPAINCAAHRRVDAGEELCADKIMTAWDGAAQAADISVEAPPRADAAAGLGPALEPALGPAFDVRLPEGEAEALVFASPHSGRDYPAELMAAAVLDAAAIRRSEDAFVDELIASGPACGAAVKIGRAHV